MQDRPESDADMFFNNIVSTKMYSLDHSTICDNINCVSKTINEVCSKYVEAQPERQKKL